MRCSAGAMLHDLHYIERDAQQGSDRADGHTQGEHSGSSNDLWGCDDLLAIVHFEL